MPKADFNNTASDWFRASEAIGDCMEIRYGRVDKNTGEIEWNLVSHCDCDGIGGFTRLLREQGFQNIIPPETKHPSRGILKPLWNRLRDSREKSKAADRCDWNPSQPTEHENSHSVAWHLFTKEETSEIIQRCRDLNTTVNSFLLKHLDQAARSEIRRPHEKISWMIPVNLRGDIRHSDDTQNHVSCVEPKISADDTPQTIHSQILHRLKRAEHRANYLLMTAGRFLTHKTKMKILEKDRTKPAGNIGAFSNLGVWNLESNNPIDDAWVFCPPCVTGQLFGAGCVTFQGQLGLAAQGYEALAATNQSAKGLVDRWVTFIRSSC